MSQLKKPTIKNPDLVAAMAEFKKQQSVQTEKEMLDAIAAASFIAPITLQNKLNEVEPDENGQRHMEASLMAVSNKDGVKFFPAFTDWLEFLKWKNDPDADTMVITFDQYCGILLKQGVDVSGIVINPAETNIVIRKEKMAEMKGVSLEAEQPQEAPKKNNILPLFGCEKVTNPEVIVAADRLRRENNEPARNNMFEAMRKARFVAPVLMEVPKEVKAGEKVNAQAEFIMLNHEGGKYMPLFTSLSELQKWNGAPDCKAVPMSMANYVAMLSDPKSTAAGIVIDPFSMGLAFSKEQALNIQPRLELRDIEGVPEGMQEALRDHLATLPAVKKAYLDGIKANGADGYVIVMDLEKDADIPTIADSTAQIAKQYGSCVVAPVDSPLGKKVLERRETFYEA
ncbi:MAG: enhanced serine sensitivity protein SseB C-terminal domain-containing protein [Ruminococcus callidus]